jgi:hypothetical protein
MSGDLELVRSIRRLRRTIKQMQTVASKAAQKLLDAPDAPLEAVDEWREMLLDFGDCLTVLKALNAGASRQADARGPDWADDLHPFVTRH